MAKQTNGAPPDQINMVGVGTVLDGTLTAESDVRVSGRVDGKVIVKGRAIVAQEGMVDGELEAENADIAGRVEGDVRVSGRLVLRGTAHIKGNIATGRLIVEEGAVFDGACTMGNRTVASEEIQPVVAATSAEDEADGDEDNSDIKRLFKGRRDE